MVRGEAYGYLRTGRPVAEGLNGAIASPHYLATQAGKEILQKGGHAVEAAMATNAVLFGVYPHRAGLGGDLFAHVGDSSDQIIIALNGSGRPGSNVTGELNFDRDFDEL